MDLPQPPQDTELKNIIDKLAQFVARNGPEFEQMTKTKQKENPKFSFLFGGNYFNYYQYKVTTEQAILKHRQAREQQQNQPPMHQPPQPQTPQPSQMGYPPGTAAAYPPQSYQNFNYPPASGYPSVDQGPFNQQTNVIPNNYHQSYPPLPPQQPGAPGVDPSPSSVGQAPVNGGAPPNFVPPIPPSTGPFPPSDNAYVPPSSYAPSTCGSENNFPPAQPAPGYPAPQDPGFVSQPPTGETVYTTAGGFPPQPAAPIPPAPGISLESLNQQMVQLQEQIKQSESNLAAQQQVLDQQKESQIREGIYVARAEALRNEANDLGLNPNELEDLLTPITESCTKDSISNGKQWIFTHAVSSQKNLWISKYLLYKATSNTGPFTHKLHIIYLMNDVLHHCVRKNAEDLKEALQKVLSPMFCHAMTIASDEQKVKLNKLLSLWESKIKLESNVVEQLRVPVQSWGEFEKMLVADFPQVVTTITAHLNTTFESYQQQHNAFVQHASTQIQQLEQQRQQIEHQQAAAVAAAAAAAVPAVLPGSPFTPPSGAQQQPPPPPTGGLPPGGPTGPMQQGLDFNQPPPGFPPGPGFPPIVDFSKPPPGFAHEEQKENLIPTVPYFELPAGLMAPLNKIDGQKYRPLDPKDLRLPPPTPPSERLLQAIENFYLPPSHERPRNSEGWEQLALYDYYKAKSQALKTKEIEIMEGKREKSRTPSPVTIEPPPEEELNSKERRRRCYRSVSPEIPKPPPIVPELKFKPSDLLQQPPLMQNINIRSRSRSKSNSRSPPRQRRSPSPGRRSRTRSRSTSSSPRRSRTRSRSASRSRSRSRSDSRSRSRSGTPPRIPYKRSISRSPSPPPSFLSASTFPIHDHRLDSSNKGHQMLKKMGWGGSGLGAKEQGISDPIAAADPRDSMTSDRFRGLGVPSTQSDPYEAFRKNKGQAFINRMRARAEEKGSRTGK